MTPRVSPAYFSPQRWHATIVEADNCKGVSAVTTVHASVSSAASMWSGPGYRFWKFNCNKQSRASEPCCCIPMRVNSLPMLTEPSHAKEGARRVSYGGRLGAV